VPRRRDHGVTRKRQETGGRSPEAGTRYDSSPVGGLGEDYVTRTQRGSAGYGEKPPPTGEYGPKQPPSPPEGYDKEPEPDDGETTEPGKGYGPSTPTEPEDGTTEPGKGYGPVDPGYEPGPETPTEPKPQPDKHPCPPSMTGNTKGMDDLQCEAKAVKAESDALGKVAEALVTRRTAFETARGDDNKARDEATKGLNKLTCDIGGLLKETRCLLNRDEAECIDKAFKQVLDCLEDCSDEQGCCIDEGCGFEKETWTTGQIDDLRRRVEKVEKCFDEVLVKEPDELKKRVEHVQKLVDDLNEALKATPREDANRLYVRAKEAEWALAGIWGRFKDVNEYQECLCCGLTCSLRGRQWLAVLAGKQAYEQCQEDSRTQRCEWLRKNIVDETLATQLILCPPGSSCGDDQSEATTTEV
jgi:hypothetical protein